MPKILAFSGSSRKDSYNKKLVKIVATVAEESGAKITLIDLRELPMPIFDEDIETSLGMPENARVFKQHMIDSDGILISSPEYNSGYSGLIKNCIDWASRKESPEEIPLEAFKGKLVSLMSTSLGTLGGLRGLVPLRMLLGNLGMIVLPGQVAVGDAMKAFDDSGQLVDEKQNKAVINLGTTIVETINAMKS